MTLGVFGRFVTAMFALAFAFVNVSPAFESPCAVHDPAFAKVASAQHHVHARTDHASAGNSSHQSDKHGQNCCKCVGCASCVSPFSLALPTLGLVTSEVQAGTAVPRVKQDSDSPRLTEYRLPYPTAPPQTLVV